MKTIDNWQLIPYGIVPHTGEACALSYRLLCDCTVKGPQDPGEAVRHLEPATRRTLERWRQGRSTRRQHHVRTRPTGPHRRLRFLGDGLRRGVHAPPLCVRHGARRRPRRVPGRHPPLPRHRQTAALRIPRNRRRPQRPPVFRTCGVTAWTSANCRRSNARSFGSRSCYR